MRTLATIALPFSAAIFAAVLLPRTAFWVSGAFLMLAVVIWLLRRPLRRRDPLLPRRLIMIFCAAAAGLFYIYGYWHLICEPVTERCGQEEKFSGIVCSEPIPTTSGGKVKVRLDGGEKSVYYGDASVLKAQPGQRIRGTAYWQDSAVIHDNDTHRFTSQGIYVLLYGRGTVEITGEPSCPLSMRLLQAVKQKAAAIWDDERTRGFTLAEMIGDGDELSEEDSEILTETGMAHLFAVSGLHCAFLVALLGLLLPRHHRRLFAAASIAILLAYMILVGLTPSVVRACVMQIALLLAPLFHRDSDGITALSGALMLLLLWNPYAAGSISLQISFAATTGLLLLSGRIYRGITGLYRGENRVINGIVAFLAANISTTLGALVFSVPLVVLYFGTLVLVSPLSSLLAVPVAGWNFMIGFVTVLLSFVWTGAARLLGWLCYACVHYVLWICTTLLRLPWHAIYTTNRFASYWILYCYTMFIGCALTKDSKRKYVLAGILAGVMLVCAVKLDVGQYQRGKLCAVAVDVGQGESVLLHSNGETILVDCGSSNSYVDAAQQVRRQLSAMGTDRLAAVVISHYHADHINGLMSLLRRIDIGCLYLPQMADEYGVRDELLSFAKEKKIRVVFVETEKAVTLGKAELTLYPPIGEGSPNEQGLSVLCRAGEFEMLITGDMAGSTEKALLERYDLPDIEVLLVSHHGSKHSSDRTFIEALQPEAAIISVGDNSYGHPAESTLARLREAGAVVYRTDECGNIIITVD